MSSQSSARPQHAEPTAPSAPVNPSGFASGVLRFAPALRVTGAEPWKVGLTEFVSRGGLTALITFRDRVALR